MKTYTGGLDGKAFALFIQQNNLWHSDFTIERYQHLLDRVLIEVSTIDMLEAVQGEAFWTDFIMTMEESQLEIRIW